MGLLLTTIAAGSVWIILISLGVKPFDGLLVALAMLLVATTAHVFAPFLPGNRREERPGDRYIRR
jgi:hypothetical protein